MHSNAAAHRATTRKSGPAAFSRPFQGENVEGIQAVLARVESFQDNDQPLVRPNRHAIPGGWASPPQQHEAERLQRELESDGITTTRLVSLHGVHRHTIRRYTRRSAE